jgi:ABC-type lipoprotein release transport system permease subunit
MYFQIAWRNIWRNPRRTTVILLAVIIGVWNMIFLGALTRGMEEGMIQNGISTLTGHIQVHKKGYRSDPVVENSMTDPGTVDAALEKVLPPGARWAPRVRVTAIAGNARHTGGITLVGIDPDREAGISFIGNAVTRGRYLTEDDVHGIVVGKALVDKFETKMGRKLVLMCQAADRDVASRAFRIVGIFTAEMEATEKQYVFVTLSAAQQMLKLKNGISEIAILLPDHRDNARVNAELKEMLPPDEYEADTWQELLPILTAYLEISDGFIYIWYIVVFIAMGFGIVNTTLMAIFERIREFGLLKSLGMKPGKIVVDVLLESFLLLLTGTAVGNLLAFLSVLALSGPGIDLSALAAGAEFAGISRMLYPVIHVKDVIVANLVVMVLGLLVSLYPAAKAARFTPVEALAHI